MKSDRWFGWGVFWCTWCVIVAGVWWYGHRIDEQCAARSSGCTAGQVARVISGECICVTEPKP